ncbi:MAG TPA: hypothetical protein PLI17_15700 [Denitromonas sp.]|nr:hypothetical protein [Denitromonas sp.]
MRRHSPSQKVKEAKQIAIDHGLFVVERPDANGIAFLLYRKAAAHAVQAARAADDDAGKKNEQAAGAAKKPMAKAKNSGRAAAGVTKGAATEAGAQVAA